MNLTRLQPHTWVLLLVAGAALWLAKKRRLADIFYAMEHGGPSPASKNQGTGAGQPLSGQNTFGPNAQPPTTWPRPSLFGLTGVTSYYLGENYSAQVRSQDQAGLSASGGGKLAHDYDYGLTKNEFVQLPGGKGKGYTLVQQSYSPAWGGWQTWRAPDGGVFEFMHLSKLLPQAAVGQTFRGGDTVGVSGMPLSLSNGYGMQLSVIADQKGDAYLRRLN